MMQSPFLTHRHILLNGYGAARWLRRLTLSLWNGNTWPTDMSGIAGLDEEHFAIAIELLAWYRKYGENDPDFMSIGATAEGMALEEIRRAERQKAYGEWEQTLIRALGKDGESLATDNYEWFLALFDKGLPPNQAAEEALAAGLI